MVVIPRPLVPALAVFCAFPDFVEEGRLFQQGDEEVLVIPAVSLTEVLMVQ